MTLPDDACPMTYNAARCQRAELRTEIERLTVDVESLRGLNNQLLADCAKAEAEIERLRAVLKPFADYAPQPGIAAFPAMLVITNGSPMARKQLTMGDCYAACAALAYKP